MDKALKTIIIIAVIGIIIALLLPSILNKKEYKEGVNVDSLLIENERLEAIKRNLFDSLEKQTVITDSLVAIREDKKKQIIYINNSKNEKLRIVDGFNDNELDSFFSTINIEASKDTGR